MQGFRKSRLKVSSQLLLEILNGINFAMFSGIPELAMCAVDAIHQRSVYELYADVILVFHFNDFFSPFKLVVSLHLI